jgi:hypothetical protein
MKNLIEVPAFIAIVMVLTIAILTTMTISTSIKSKDLRKEVAYQKQVVANQEAKIVDLLTDIWNLERDLASLTSTQDDTATDTLPVHQMQNMKPIGIYKRTFYKTVPGVTGTIGSSGKKLHDGAVAMNQETMKRHGLKLMDEVCLLFPDGREEWCIILDIAEADVVDSYTTGVVPSRGIDYVEVWKKV